MRYTHENLMNILNNPHISKTIHPNTIIIPTCENCIRIVLHGNPIYDVFKDNYNGFIYMRILPDSFSWFTNTTQTRIGLLCTEYGFHITRSSKPEKRYILEKFYPEKTIYSNKLRCIHVIYEDSRPFPLNDIYRREFKNNEYTRGYAGNLIGDYIYNPS